MCKYGASATVFCIKVFRNNIVYVGPLRQRYSVGLCVLSWGLKTMEENKINQICPAE